MINTFSTVDSISIWRAFIGDCECDILYFTGGDLELKSVLILYLAPDRWHNEEEFTALAPRLYKS